MTYLFHLQLGCSPAERYWSCLFITSLNMMREEEEEETVFDQEGLLGGEKKSSCGSAWLRRFSKTIALSFAFFALGLCIAIPGPTLLDLGERTNSSTEAISLIFTARSVGYLFGSVVGGVLFDYFDQQILLFYTLGLTSFATITIPWCTLLATLAAMIAVQGIAIGILDTGGNVFCLKIWGKASPPYMQTLHFAFGVGAFLAPLLAHPFLMGEGPLGSNTTAVSSHIPINTKLPSILQSASVGVSFERSDSHLTDEFGGWWFTGSKQHRVLRESSGGIVTFENDTYTSGNVSFLNTTTSLSTEKATTVRVLKPNSADAKHLSKDGHVASGKHLNEALEKLKNDLKEKEIEKTSTGEDADNKEVNDDVAQPTNKTLLSSNDTFSNLTATGDKELNASHTAASFSFYTLPATLPQASTPMPTTSTITIIIPSPATISHSAITTTANPVGKPSIKAEDQTSIAVVTPGSSTSRNASDTTSAAATIGPRKSKPQILDAISSALDAVKNMSKIQFAYLTIGLFLLLDATFFAILYCRDYRAGTLLHQVEALGPAPVHLPRCFRTTLLLFLFIFFLVYVGMEVTFGAFLATFSVESNLIKLSRPDGAMLTALFWGCIAMGRGLAILVARCFKPPCMLVSGLVFMVIGALLLSFTLQASPTMLWVGTVTLGLGMSSIFPTAVSWANCYYPLTGRAAAVFVAGSGVGEMTIPVLTGYLFENYTKLSLMYMILGLAVVLTGVYTCLQCTASRHCNHPSASKMGFVRLQTEDEVIALDGVGMGEVVNGMTGLKENVHRRRPVASSRIENKEETACLVDIAE